MQRLMPILRVLLAIATNVALVAAVGLPLRPYINPPGPATPWWAWVAVLPVNPLFAVQALLFFRFVDRRKLSEFALRWDERARQAALWGALISAVMLGGFVALTQAAGVTHWSWNTGFDPASMVLTALLTAVAGFGEEFLFRGYIMETLQPYGRTGAILLSSVFFALMHTVTGRTNPWDLLALFLHGLFFAILATRSRSVWPGVIIHCVYNGLTALVWTGDPHTALLAVDVIPVALKWAYKGVIIVPLLAMVWAVYGERRPAKQGAPA